jgi:hypothetical protein
MKLKNWIVFGMIVLMITLSLGSVNESLADGVGTYSTGYRFGNLNKGGLKKGFLGQISSWEGYMLMGVESTPIVIKETVARDKKGNETSSPNKIVNPWAFSSRPDNNDIHKKLNKFLGEYVVIQYKQVHTKFPNVDTDYEVIDVLPISDTKLTEAVQIPDFDKVYGDENDTAKVTQKSKSKMAGRFIKTSEKGTFIDSQEITFQQGTAGSLFTDMSIRDKSVYEAAITALKSGQKVKVYYIQNYMNLDLTGRETSYEIVKIEPDNSKKFE